MRVHSKYQVRFRQFQKQVEHSRIIKNWLSLKGNSACIELTLYLLLTLLEAFSNIIVIASKCLQWRQLKCNSNILSKINTLSLQRSALSDSMSKNPFELHAVCLHSTPTIACSKVERLICQFRSVSQSSRKSQPKRAKLQILFII